MQFLQLNQFLFELYMQTSTPKVELGLSGSGIETEITQFYKSRGLSQ